MTEQVGNLSDSVEMTLETDTNNHEEEFDFNRFVNNFQFLLINKLIN